MSTSTHTDDEVTQIALRLLDEGKSEAEILAAYPEHAASLRAIFDLIVEIKMGAHIQPSPELLRATLSKIKTPIASPLTPSHFPLWQVSVSVLTAFVLVVGGVSVVDHGQQAPSSTVQPAVIAMSHPSNISDAALDQDANAIDSQLGALSDDESQVDAHVHGN